MNDKGSSDKDQVGFTKEALTALKKLPLSIDMHMELNETKELDKLDIMRAKRQATLKHKSQKAADLH